MTPFEIIFWLFVGLLAVIAVMFLVNYLSGWITDDDEDDGYDQEDEW